jgi:excisionase family DNA binding protein
MTEPTGTTVAKVEHFIMPADLMTPVEAARLLRTSKSALYGWLARGDIRHYRVGRLVRIRGADLAEYLERHRNEPPARPSRYASR